MKDKPPTLPPILPDIENLLKEYLICPERLPIHNYEQNQEFWPREPDVTELFHHEKVSCGTTLKVHRDYNTGKIIEFREVTLNEVGLNARNSMSLTRAPLPSSDNVRGDPGNFPFWPGGIPLPQVDVTEDKSTDFSELLTIPPGFSQGLQFQEDGFTVLTDKDNATEKLNTTDISDETDNTINLINLVQKEQDFFGLWNETKNEVTKTESPRHQNQIQLEINEAEVIPQEPDVLIISDSVNTNKKSKDTEWAVAVDIQQNVNDFHEKIPDMAMHYDFELDTFQKQAILKLEENCDVFVAAHTSAGKTVVAEYAIALSQKHKTRTIYTSPIKALSNQKYRDFKKKFQDVGLITGDFQINQTGVCLIMTTEILRSMLYRGSEVIRDLEYVVFDEVHYINDTERGHVWEEVLIMLPDHVRIVLLSATVPNTMEFATWLGMTKQRKIYVISTLFRPVPLQHYLYTGTGGKSKDERFLLINAKGTLLLQGYNDAMQAINSRKKSGECKFIPPKNKIKQEGTALSGLINHLERNELLPVVMFTFSRNMCDNMADTLKNTDLTTATEKNKIHTFFKQCLNRLKEADQDLPQILTMQKILRNGIGVHHSGILPIVREIVEMLFHDGLVKVLFATETFAMGVNMPARTVVFNSIKKFDGHEKRYLKPAEYIQMAGRAGRRGLDKTGTVIIRCVDEVTDIQILKAMMQGRPQRLESQFRLTYSMLLSLLQVTNLTIETMMSHSFYEVKHVTKKDELKIELEKTEAALAVEQSKEIKEHLQHLVKFYQVAAEFIREWHIVQPKLMLQPRVVKELVPGRVLLVSHKSHYKKLAILLNVKKDHLSYKILVLDDQKRLSENIELSVADNKTDKENETPAMWYRMINLTREDIFQPDGVGGHKVLEIIPQDIMGISKKIIKIDCDLVLKDWDKRQIVRFRDDPPGQTCHQAIQELTKLTNNVLSGAKVEYLEPSTDYQINDIDLHEHFQCLNKKYNEVHAQLGCTKIANFEEQFLMVFKRKHLEEKLEKLKWEMSNRSLTLYPEYESRILLLKKLRYIDEEHKLDMKGRVACEMGMHELLITELVLRNTLASLQPAEVAALLSALVFQVKSNKDKKLPELTDTLNKKMIEINDIFLELKSMENHYLIKNLDEDLNFDLVEVVYEWAREKRFADIMNLTDVQEGIIVRCIQQLNETLKDVKEAARIIGYPELKSKMDEASTAIKRDIVFAASLYT